MWEGRHEVGLQHDVRGVAGGLRDRGDVHDRVHAGDEREGGYGVGEVGHHVAAGHHDAGVEDGTDEVDARDIVAGGDERLDGGAADLAAGSGDEDLHDTAPSSATSAGAFITTGTNGSSSSRSANHVSST